ncbi:MAG: hypothetical protein RI580_06690 [Halothece sp. Uz-M2-17]|nr:hypothetical protein [Halothece sp. Uz-M2-17]
MLNSLVRLSHIESSSLNEEAILAGFDFQVVAYSERLEMQHVKDKGIMDQEQLMNVIPVVIAVIIGIGGFLMMFTTVFTTRR